MDISIIYSIKNLSMSLFSIILSHHILKRFFLLVDIHFLIFKIHNNNASFFTPGLSITKCTRETGVSRKPCVPSTVII